jgi:hypothetical protein
MRNREPGRAQPDFRQRARRGGYNCVPVWRKGTQEFRGSGQSHNSFDVFNLQALDFAIFRLMVRVREEFADGADAGPPMRNFHHGIGIKAMLPRPNGPHPRHRRRRIN